MIQSKNEYNPDYFVSPGDILNELLETKKMKKREFAERCGLSPKTISKIIAGEVPVSPEYAIIFQRILGHSSAIWSNLEANYRLQLAIKKEIIKFEEQVSWAKEFPITELSKRGYIEKPKTATEYASNVLNFFGVANVSAWEDHYMKFIGSFRKSPTFTSDTKALTAWLRIGEIYSQNIDCEPYQKDAFKKSLTEIRSLTKEGPDVFQPEIKKICQKVGVVIKFEPELPKTFISGATMWINKEKALIMLSARHKTDDHLWFTIFHEAAHILLHGKKMIFIDCINNSGDKKLEDEANKFATDILIPPNEYAEFISKTERFNKEPIKKFAQKLDVAPGIVVGRLQKDELISYQWHNKLKRRFLWG